MAEVWLADDGVLERGVVVKLLAPAADLPRFEREARAAATLAHPNIVQSAPTTSPSARCNSFDASISRTFRSSRHNRRHSRPITATGRFPA
jgi:serine/threonine protein kinase